MVQNLVLEYERLADPRLVCLPSLGRAHCSRKPFELTYSPYSLPAPDKSDTWLRHAAVCASLNYFKKYNRRADLRRAAVMDLKGVGITSINSVYSYIKSISAISQNYYPERLGKLCMCSTLHTVPSNPGEIHTNPYVKSRHYQRSLGFRQCLQTC